MSTENRSRVRRGVSTGGQFATEIRTEDATVSLAAAPPATRNGVLYPPKSYTLDRTQDGVTYNDSRGSWPMQTVEPTTHSEAKRALSTPGLRGGQGRIDDLFHGPSSNNSTYDVIGPKSGAPLVVNVHSGFHQLNVRGGNVDINVQPGTWGGSTEVHGGRANITVNGSTKYHVEVHDQGDDGPHAVRLSDDARVSVYVRSTRGATYVQGGHKTARVHVSPGATVNQDGPEEYRARVEKIRPYPFPPVEPAGI